MLDIAPALRWLKCILQVMQELKPLEKELIRYSRVSSRNQIYLFIVTQLLRATQDSIDRNSALEIT